MDVQLHLAWDGISVEESLASFKLLSSLPSVENLIRMIKSCRAKKNLAIAQFMNVHIHENGLEGHRVVGNYVVPMLVDCGGISDAWQAFHRLTNKNEHAWTSLLQGLVDFGECQHALSLFHEMLEDCVYPSKFTLQALLKACAALKCLERGWQIHAEILMLGYDSDLFIGNTLIDLYAKCGAFAEAWEVFYMLPGRDTVTWNALMSGCTEHKRFEEALFCAKEMQQDGFCPSIATFLCTLKACGNMKVIERGQEVHAKIVTEGFETDPFIGNSLVDMYAKCASLPEAVEVFGELKARGIDSWNTVMSGFLDCGLTEEALSCLEKMHAEGVSPDKVTFLCSLHACGEAGFIDEGRNVHGNILKKGFKVDSYLGNSLVDLYAKCGFLVEAKEVFHRLPNKDLVSWNALLTGYARLGDSTTLFFLLELMIDSGAAPNLVTFLSVLSVCSHAGLIVNGIDVFKYMVTCYRISPTMEHKSCIVGLLDRAGQMSEAVLSACKTWDDLETGKQASEWVIESGKNNAKACISMPNLSADAEVEGATEDLLKYVEVYASIL